MTDWPVAPGLGRVGEEGKEGKAWKVQTSAVASHVLPAVWVHHNGLSLPFHLRYLTKVHIPRLVTTQAAGTFPRAASKTPVTGQAWLSCALANWA